jgi:cell division protein FtsZ
MVARGSDDASLFSYGEGKGTDRATDAIGTALGSPLVAGGQAVAEAECVIVSILGGPDLTLREIETIMTAVRATARKDAHLLMGTAIDLAWAGAIAVTLVVSRNWNADAVTDAAPAASKAGIDPAEAPAPKPGGRKKKGGGIIQPGLGLDRDISKGMFKDVEPTVIAGVDMDIPTFIRRRVTIEK